VSITAPGWYHAFRMGQDVFVDVAYRGLEVGRRVKLVDVGPRTAYLEHGTPMPVGSGLVIRTDVGLAIPVVVIRIHEQVAGAELPPGMRIRSDELDGDAAGWWRALVSREEDPSIPELPVQPVVPMPPPDAVVEVAEVVEEESTEASAPAPIGKDTRVMDVPELAAVLAAAEESNAGNGAPDKGEKREPAAGATMVMSAVEIEAITGEIPTDDADDGEEETSEASADAPDASDNGAPGSNGDEMRGKPRGRRKRRRR
jgi:hypothetical protein